MRRPAARVLRTGMGPARARIAAARALAIDARRGRGRRRVRRRRARARAGRRRLRDRASPRRRRADRRARQRATRRATLLHGAASACTSGPLLSTERLTGPAERRALAAAARSRVDMESAWLAEGAGGRPLAVVRVVADAAGRAARRPADARRTARARSRRCAASARARRVGAPSRGERDIDRGSCSSRQTAGRDERSASPGARGRPVPDAAAAAQERQVPAARGARAAVPVQPRVLVLREDPVPGAHPQEADAGRPGARGDRGVGRADGLDRGRRAARASRGRT